MVIFSTEPSDQWGGYIGCGDRSYDICLSINTLYNKIRRFFGFKYWSLSSYLKSKVKKAIEVFNRFDELAVRMCILNSYDGMIYGHSHCPGIKTIKTKILINDGDMVESITAVVEDISGEIKLIKLTDNKILASV